MQQGEDWGPWDDLEEFLRQGKRNLYFINLGWYRYALKIKEATGSQLVLDVCCGSGYGTNLLGCVGVDVDLTALKVAKTRYPYLDLIRSDINHLPLRCGIFDMIAYMAAIEHVDDPRRSLLELYTLLKMGGFLVCSTPNGNLLSLARKFKLQKFGLAKFNPHHIREYCVKSFKRELENAGFNSIEIQGLFWLPNRLPTILYKLSSILGKISPFLDTPLIAVAKKGQ